MNTHHSSLDQAIYDMIHLPENASIVDLGCRNAGYLNAIIETFPGRVVKAVGTDVSDKNFKATPHNSRWCSVPKNFL